MAQTTSPAVRWLHVYPGVGDVVGLATAPSNGVYALATVGGHVTVRQIAASGTTVRKVTVGTTNAGALGSDASGFYVGWFDSNVENTTGLASIVRKVGNSGHTVWTQRWGTVGAVGEIHGIAASAGEVYVLYTYQGGQAPRVKVLNAGTGHVDNDWLIDADAIYGSIAVNATAVYTATVVANDPNPGTSLQLTKWHLNGTSVWHDKISAGANNVSARRSCSIPLV